MLSGLLAQLTTQRKNEIYGSPYTYSEKPTTSDKGNVWWLQPNSDSLTFARNNVQSKSQS